jgi:DNA-binding MarR family transcriptional regulator
MEKIDQKWRPTGANQQIPPHQGDKSSQGSGEEAGIMDLNSSTITDNTLTRARGVAHLIEQVCRFAYEDKRPEALHSVQWSALRYFSRANEQVRTVNGLAKYLGVTSAPASRTAASLVKRGLVTMRQSPRDARSNIFTLTETGLQLLPEDPIGKVAHILAEMNEDDLCRLAAALDNVHSKLLS